VFSSSAIVRIGVRTRFSVWRVCGYAHVLSLLHRRFFQLRIHGPTAVAAELAGGVVGGRLAAAHRARGGRLGAENAVAADVLPVVVGGVAAAARVCAEHAIASFQAAAHPHRVVLVVPVDSAAAALVLRVDRRPVTAARVVPVQSRY